MKKEIILMGILLIAIMPLITASGFSPSSLVFNLSQNGEGCKQISVTSDSETISVADKWAENKDIEWKVSLFNESAASHGITINYPSQLTTERQVEVCLSGSNVGEYHGVLLLREEQQGNSVVQMGIWLKVTISETPAQTPVSNNNQNTGSGGGVSGGSATAANTQATNTTTIAQNTESNTETSTQTETQEEESNAGITGAVIGAGRTRYTIIIITAVALMVAGILIYTKRRRVNQI